MLETLVVVKCGLSEAPNIQPIAHSIHELALVRNEISSLSSDYFDGCDMLKILALGHNGFKTIPNITKICDTIETLQMNGNCLSDISMLYNTKFLRLETLNLANNDIDVFPYPKWRWPRLRLLRLQHNCIKSITHDWFRDALEPLNLVAHNNSWDCTKDLCWLRNCTFGHFGHTAGYKCGGIGSWMSLHWGMTCASPREWKGQDIAGYTQAPSQYEGRHSRYRDFHYKDKMVVIPLHLYNGNPHHGKRHIYIEMGSRADTKFCRCHVTINFLL